MTTINSNHSVGKNLSISLVILLVIVTTSTVIIFAYITSVNDRRNLENKADELIQNMVKSIEFPIWNFDNESLAKITDAYCMSEYISELTITDARSKKKLAEYKKDKLEKDLVFRSQTIFHNNMAIAHVVLGLTKSFNRARLANLFYSYLATTLILIFILVMATDYLLKVFLKRPFDNLIHGMQKMSIGDYNYDSDVPREKEFKAIAERFKYMAQQIHEREKSLNRAKNYISDIFNSIDSIIAGVDSNLQITHWNKSAQDFTGLSMEAVKRENFAYVFPQFLDVYETIWNTVKSQVSKKENRFSIFVNDEQKKFSISVLPLSFEGENGAVVLIQDISERIKLEEMIIQTEKMLSVGGLAAGMAHEINNPLAGILQNIQVIENRLFKVAMPSNVKAAQQCGINMSVIMQYLELRKIPVLFESARNAGKRAARIVENMLSFSRTSDSTLLENDLATIFNDTVELASNDYDLKKKYDFKNIKIVREFQENLHGVPCDSTKIQQVILNILKNGAQAMQSNNKAIDPPCFTVRIREVEISRRFDVKNPGLPLASGKELELQIEDNGPGMDEETRKRVFEPFFTTKPVGVGTGLGLSVSYFIITENHNGTMSVKSSPGNGAVFIIRLPLKHN
ncbi:MAG: PAS domain-containing protein [Desulfamplus sp.]|nr:PAS domain-containing protein [Desulfamplus sp.]